MSEKIISVLSFYKFIKLQSLEILKKEIWRFMSQRNIQGTIILSPEGVNINICGDRIKIEESKKFLLRRLKIHKVFFNEDKVSEVAFTKLKVKIKKEIIKLGFHLQQNQIIDHEHVDSSGWDKLMSSDTTIIDTRNKFEYLMGSFKNSINLDLYNFSDLENKIIKLSLPAKSKDIGIFCTGGIRCEKASLVLRKLGYKKIYQLRGGIINYLRDKPSSTNWQGECFVFDDRITY